MKHLGIYTSSLSYSEKLRDYLFKKLEYEYSVSIISEKDEISKLTSEGTVDALLIEDVLYDEAEIGLMAAKLIVITNDRNTVIAGAICVYKYGPVNSFLDVLVNKDCIRVAQTDNSNTRLSAFYSPIGGIGLTSTSIAYTKAISSSSKVLYINMSCFCALLEMLYLEESNTISEALYNFMTKGGDECDIKKYIQRADGYDVIAPARTYVELKSFSNENIRDYLMFLRNESNYEEIVVELSECIDSFIDLFKIFDITVIGQKDGIINKKKLEAFIKEVKGELSDKFVEERVKFITIPTFSCQEEVYEGIESTQLGRWMKEIIDQI